MTALATRPRQLAVLAAAALYAVATGIAIVVHADLVETTAALVVAGAVVIAVRAESSRRE